MKKLFNGIYEGKKVLITGHTGFKGSWLSLWLSQLGANIVGYSNNVPTTPNHFELLNLKMIYYLGDIRDKEKIHRTIENQRPDIIFHLAAQPLVLASYVNPLETLETNIIGTLNILESCRKLKCVKAVVNITSDKCYRNDETHLAFKEGDPLGGNDPYSASKGCVEIVANAYRKSFFDFENESEIVTQLANVRAGNVIGGGDWAKDRLIPDIMKAVNRGETVVIRNPNATRPWQHVLEPLSGYLHLGAKLLEGKKEFAQDWNFGPNVQASIPVHQVVKNVKKHWEKINYEIRENNAVFSESKVLNLDSTKARTKLKWKPVWNADKTFEKTTNWYKKYYESNTINSIEDLSEYISEAKKQSLQWTV